MSEAEDPIPQSDLPARFAMGVLMIGVAGAATWLGGWPFRILVAAAAAAMIVEWGSMHRLARGWIWTGAVLLAINLLVAVELFFPVGDVDVVEEAGQVVTAIYQERIDVIGYVLGTVLIAGVLLGLLSRRASLGWGYTYVGLPAAALLTLSWLDVGVVFWVLVVTWATDILAYFAGRAIGGPKLAPGISPNKTWAGLIGGMVGAGLFGWLVASWFEMEPIFLWAGALMGAIAQAGDLYESWVKRRAGVKDSGTMLPGHGGVLDRLDGLLAVAIATTLLLMAGLWTG